ncbi:MAG: ABC transporter ATP-binding protein [Planctomycetes bacterium]|nr:ABC transporter ATP-binding protein [Planctomycetota bacterium]
MTAPAVEFDAVSKRFHKGARISTLAGLVLGAPRRWLARKNESGLLPGEFYALSEVTFALQAGESLGILGPNGSGKSTVLKLLFRILRPDAGQVRAKGRVGGLIELGAGFHPYLSGRENVFINGAILGMTRAQVRQRYDSIVEFAGIAEFMDMPVKDYSSGMYARLAFAIAAHADPDVLLVDEVLAVGDATFQLKCYDWMARMRKSGRAVVAVSHDLYAMAASSRCLYLNAGKPVLLGEPRAVIDRYLQDLSLGQRDPVPETSFVKTESGQARAVIERVEFLGDDGQQLRALEHGAELTIRFHFQANAAVESPMFGLTLFHDDARIPLSSPRHYLFQAFSGEAFKGMTLRGKGVVEVSVKDVRLPVGSYRAKTYLYERDGVTPIFLQDGATRIEVKRPGWSDGRALLDHRQTWGMPVMAEGSQP